MTTRLSGVSDDLIDLDGDLSDEITADQDGNVLAFSNGTALRIHYTDSGVWRITPVGGPPVEIYQAPEGNDDDYSDRAVLPDGITWVVVGTEVVHAK